MVKIECPLHQLTVAGDASPALQAAIANGRLVCTTGIFCDHRLPPQMNVADGDVIDCVGPDDPNCPHPDQAKKVE